MGFFQYCGDGPTSVELPLDEDGRASGKGVITFKSMDDAKAALKLNNSDFGGRWMKVGLEDIEKTLSVKEDGCVSVFVGNLDFNIDEETLRNTFQECGEITNVKFGMDRETGDFKGYAHIDFQESSSTDKAVAMTGTFILGRSVKVDFSKPRNNFASKRFSSPSVKEDGCMSVFIGNLDFNIDEDTVRNTFQECGDIKNGRFGMDRETGDFKGYGHMFFYDSSSTDKAVAMSGNIINGRPVRVDFAKEKKEFGSGGRGGGRGRGRGGRIGFSGGRSMDRTPSFSKAKKGGSISAFEGKKITFD